MQDVIDLKFESISWKTFMLIVGLDGNDSPKAATAAIALDIAAGMGIPISPKHSSEPGYFFTPNKSFHLRVQKR